MAESGQGTGGGAPGAPPSTEEEVAAVPRDPALALPPSSAFPMEECPVCFEAMGGACPQRKLSCGHSFHHACIQRWLQRNATCPLCKSAAPEHEESSGEGGGEGGGAAPRPHPAFHIDMGHQEMAQVVHELEDIFRAVHECAGPDHPVAVNGLAYNLCTSLGYEDEDELEEALGGSLADFLGALPHFSVVWPEAAALAQAEGGQPDPKALMKPEPAEEELVGPGARMLFTVTEREDLWRVVLQGARATVEIPEIEFAIRPQASRRVDTIYNMIAGAIFHLGDHVQKNRRLGGALSEEDANRICDTIDSLNTLLDLEQPFTFVLSDPQGVSELKPSDGMHVGPYAEEEAPRPEPQAQDAASSRADARMCMQGAPARATSSGCRVLVARTRACACKAPRPEPQA
eukprot:CAMPEP_0175688302 /NCGR_PEP_ID=MMETSP0097-20121207/28811_1 /TAXON_ID=311494 /ORGANISM="Alexandrium monilatum, Strain CCMP3105" /LENGTH=401 /DNA_ID=CAMNT_0016995315 /DNA_START=1 /DNA_END=1204 /DNA_ORIENTATION=+